MGDRGQDSREPTLLPDVAAAPAVVRIDTLLGRTYFAQAQAIEAARTNGERDVPLCLLRLVACQPTHRRFVEYAQRNPIFCPAAGSD